uniref:Uncharacterized protein n=1 Tax=Knipowitschia caucasica TaxID=637954 RepID=A0AAV2LQ22_KNICA
MATHDQRPPQDIDWKEQLKREIMDDVQAQMKGLTKDIVAELKPLLQSASPQPSSPNPTWNRPYSPRPYNDRDEQGRPICHRCRKAGSLLSPGPFNKQRAWRDAFATCRHIEVAPAGDGLIGHVRLASKRNVTVPPKSRFKKLGRLYYIDDSDVHGTNDLALTVEEDGVVQVALVNANVEPLSSELPAEKSILGDRPDLSAQQQGELHALLQKWESVFAQHKEDFGRTNIVQHRIPTGDAAPTRERYRPIPPMLYKEMKTLLAGLEICAGRKEQARFGGKLRGQIEQWESEELSLSVSTAKRSTPLYGVALGLSGWV